MRATDFATKITFKESLEYHLYITEVSSAAVQPVHTDFEVDLKFGLKCHFNTFVIIIRLIYVHKIIKIFPKLDNQHSFQ